MARTDVVTRDIAASPGDVFAAFVDKDALAEWLPPAGMYATFEFFDPRPGGSYRMVLRFMDDTVVAGKTARGRDVVNARITEVVPGERLVQEVDFESDDPAFGGTMTMTWSVAAAEGGCHVEIRADNVPAGISAEDHAAGMESSLENLERYVTA